MEKSNIKEYSDFLNGQSPENVRVKLAVDDVQKSGLSAETLSNAGIKLFNDKSDILKKWLGFISINGNPILSIVILMEIPYHDENGAIIKRVYRLYPETDDKKYLHPLGSAPIPYIAPQVWAIKNKVNKPIWITEGEKKAQKLIQHSKACIGLSGVYGFRAGKNEGTDTLLCKELETFSWKGRSVYLAFDRDVWINPQVRKALYELAFHLVARGALVYICAWKNGKGIDDHLAIIENPEKELEDIEDKAKAVLSFIAPEHRDDVLYGLSKTFDSMDDLIRESVINAISKKLNIRPRSLYKVLIKETLEQGENFTEEEKEAAIKLLRSPALIKLFLDMCHTRYVGRDKTLLLIKLATMTRHLNRGLSVVLLGTSSVGKSALIETVLMTIDQTATENFSRTSAQYLLYRKEPLEHKIIIFYEFNGADSSSAIIRTALTEGELHLGTVQKDASGSLCATEIKKETQGLVILSTYTGSHVDTELSTRVLLQEISHDKALAREVYRQKAKGKKDHTDAFRLWQCADSLIEARPVIIPYMSKLADIFPTNEERFHRDFDKTVMLIKASALLHQYQREQIEDGSVIANEEDYRLIYDLGDAFAQSLLPVSEPVLNMLNVAKTSEKPTRAVLQEKIGVSAATMKRYIGQAKRAELIDTEGRGQNQTVSVLDVPLSCTVLPDPEKIFIVHSEPLSQTSQSLDNAGHGIAHEGLSQCEPNELNREWKNGSNGSNGIEPKVSHILSHSTQNSSTAQIEDNEFFVHEEEIPEIQGAKRWNS